jgi:hypothetical protein
MAYADVLDDLEIEQTEDAVTAEIPVTDPATLPEDLGDAPPPGETHALLPEVDVPLGLDPVDIAPTIAQSLAPTGLNARDRIRARDLAVRAAALALNNAGAIEYSMDIRKRWDPIKRNRKAFRGQFGRFQDCSSFATWCLWNGLDHFGVGDIVNGARFQRGFTGTMTAHGRQVSRGDALRGDCVFYCKAGTREINHVALYVGGGMVISHGSEPGPSKLRMDYRPIAQIRRYIYA